MHKIVLNSVLLTFIFVTFAFCNTILLKGKVISAKDSGIISYANVVDKNSKQSVLCDKNGSFFIQASSEDTLIILALGYQSKIYHVNDLIVKVTDLVLSLEPQVYEIDTVLIAPYKTYNELKIAILNIQIPEEKKLDLNIPQLPPDAPIRYENGQAIYSLGSPITALYNQFSRRGKEIRQYQELMQKREIENRVAKKYNRELVKRLTGITEDEEVKKFMTFCNLSNEFILRNSDYFIYRAVDKCLEEYKKTNN